MFAKDVLKGKKMNSQIILQKLTKMKPYSSGLNNKEHNTIQMKQILKANNWSTDNNKKQTLEKTHQL